MSTLSPFRVEVPDARLEAIRRAVAAFDWRVLPDLIEEGDAWSDLRRPNGRGEAPLDEVFGLDDLVTNLMFYVATDSFATATRIYRAAQHEVMRVPPVGSRIGVSSGFASFPCEIRPSPPRSLVRKTYDVCRFTEFEQGGHFAALERTDDFTTEISPFMRQIREAR